MYIDSFRAHFTEMQDPRQISKITYSLLDVVFGTLCAVIAGARSWFEIHEYVLGQHAWFLENNLFVSGVPIDDTFARVISAIDPKWFRHCFLKWMKSIHQITAGQLVAIDGKTLRSSYSRDDPHSAIHMISAYASANKLVLGQLKISGKSNEITGIPELLKMLDLRGALVSIDAMGCQVHIAKSILSQGGHYLLAVKGNQGSLSEALKKAFAPARRQKQEELRIEAQHGRYESHVVHVLDAERLEGDFSRWPDLKTIALVEHFSVRKGELAKLSYRYYISSQALSAEEIAQATREHWGIESMHWFLDVCMQEDACQIYQKNAAENLACLRHMALNMLRAEKTKISLSGKQRRCWMNTDNLERVLQAGLSNSAE